MTEPSEKEGQEPPPLHSGNNVDAATHPVMHAAEVEPTQRVAYPPAADESDPNLPPLTPDQLHPAKPQGPPEPQAQPEQAQAGDQQAGFDYTQYAQYSQQAQQAQYTHYQYQQHTEGAGAPDPQYLQAQGTQYAQPGYQQPQHAQHAQPQQPQQLQQPQQALQAQQGQHGQHGQHHLPSPAQGIPLPQPQQQRPRHALNSDDLSGAQLVRRAKRHPRSGWRKAVYLGTGKLVNPGEGPTERRRRELVARVKQPVRGCYKIAMLSLKGGVGKTTTTTTLGSTFASERGDRVIAVDANPDRGTLAQKIPIETTATVRHLLRDAARITKYSDVRAYTSQGSSRLEILASEQDPAVSEAFSEADYRQVVNLLEHFYNIVLTDCGTGLMHSAMKGVLDSADALVLVSSGSVDGARSASATLDWLDAHGYGDLVSRSVAVINSVRPKSGSVDLGKLGAHFAARTRGVVRIPFDPHLEEGAEIELERLEKETQLAFLELAAAVADGFADRMAR